MYIEYKKQKYNCECRPRTVMTYKGLPDDFPFPVDGEIVLCDDNGFVMRTDKAEDYLRQTFHDGALTLTNVVEAAGEPVHLTAEQKREEAYNTQPVIEWGGEMLTVTQASQKWQYYAAEGDTEQATALTTLIAEAKKEIRAQWPDEGVTE